MENQHPDSLFKVTIEPLKDLENDQKTVGAMVAEFSGTFLFVAFFLIASDNRTHFSNDRAINAMVIASAYVGVRLMSGGRLVTGIP
mmetsp:Transcript_10043/g.15298  ORF Transcript_10043/g.15298 Transcript_10043/m.15298 type:complete len:86 (+) Transcript_10043:356-613(+)